MLWTKIFKAIPLLLQVALVVGAVLVFAFFDPFGIFISTKTKLKDTPVDVQSIRSIGKLITAEYYGEVISSYAHGVVEKDNEHFENSHQAMLDLLNYYTQEINDLHELLEANEIKKKDILSVYHERFKDVENDDHFGLLLYYIKNRQRFKAKNLDERLSKKEIKNLVRSAVREGYKTNDPIFKPGYLDNFDKAVKSIQSKQQRSKLKKKNLVLLGRGWVKAGFDFENFTEHNFHYDKKHQAIYFIGLTPKILSSTINPWFIPEKGVEGFEFLVVDKRARHDYKILQMVKQQCLDKLKRKAYERDILQKASANGSESLKEFFEMITGSPIRQVTFYDHEWQFIFHDIIQNDSITGEELVLLQHLLTSAMPRDTAGTFQQNKLLFEELKSSAAGIYLFDQQVADHWQPWWSVLYEITEDGSFDEADDPWKLNHFLSDFQHLNQKLDTTVLDCSNIPDEYLHWMAEHSNYYVARDSVSIRRAVELAGNQAAIDSLFTESTLTGVSIDTKNIPKIHEFYDTMLRSKIVFPEKPAITQNER